MKNVMPSLLFLLLLQLYILPATAQKAGDNSRLIYSLFAVLNKHDSIVAGAFFADSVKLQSPNWEGIQTGRQAAITVYSRYFKGTPDIHFEITNIIAAGTKVIVEYTFGGKFSNPEEGTPAYMRGKDYNLKGVTIYSIAGNKITSSVSYFDQVAFLRQVGFFDNH
ncbi:MAG TPA: ester cyclase [Chitinophagaceae bacterium]|nr:ester cyclase [Chitinophagaceae bacterium]